MSSEMLWVIGVLVGAVVLFATEWISVDVAALLVMTILMLSGTLSSQEGIGGFSDSATVTVAAMFILSAGLSRTGAVNAIADRLARIVKKSFWLGLATLMLSVGTISAFINNTACVALFLPIALMLARVAQVSPSKLLMPVSFAAILGGTCTLIGTSPNLVVNSVAVSHGLEPFGMFEFGQLGLLTLVMGSVYMLILGTRLIPDRRSSSELTNTFAMGDYLTEIVLLPEASSVGKLVGESPLVHDLDIDILQIYRDADVLSVPLSDVRLHANDILRVRCDVEKLRKLQGKQGIQFKSNLRLTESTMDTREVVLVEAVIAPASLLVGRSLKQINFRARFGATAIAIRHHEELLHENLGNVPLRAGDVLLIEARRDHLGTLKGNSNFVLISETEESWFRRRRIPVAVLIFAAVVTAVTLGASTVLAALMGALMMVLTGCLTVEEAYRALDLKVLFMIAGSLSLGAALEKTGTAVYLAERFASSLGGFGSFAVVGGVYLITMILTELISNAATAALVSPLAIGIGLSLGLDPRPLLVAVTFASSASFMTPVGYQTNTMIFGPGQYRFSDFLRVGVPLNLMCWALATVMIPLLWPL
ncbi:MAG: SLC13 family permease [Armatimonadetes bacterium]|nr:SLC13 family permease [Armatimonadota bacterium]